MWRGREYETLREVAETSGIPVSTLRSRLHRVRTSAHRLVHDITHDRRSNAVGRRCAILVPAPDGGPVTLQDFARRTGIPKATVTHRYRQLLRAERRPEAMHPDQIRAFLTTQQDRRIVLELEVGPGVVWSGGVRELIRRVLDNTAVESRRLERIGCSAIRCRLRLVPGWPDRIESRCVRWAFGFEAPVQPR